MIASSSMLLKPKPADAFIDCILQAAGLLGGATSAVSAVLAVPVHDVSVGVNTSMIAGDAKSLSLKECLLDRIAYTLVNTMIQNFTASTVDWINSGFEGSPSFVTDPEGFFGDVGDQVAGKWIQSLGPIGDVLCSPFDFQIRLSLSLGRTSSYRRYVGCRLSDVQKNIYGAFVGGDWGSNGWSNWVSISQTNNNIYGAYLVADDRVTQNVLRKIGINKDELSWNGGFLSWRKCLKKDPSTGKCQEYDKNVNTPGSVIESQLNSTLGSSQRRIEMADEINEILDALMNQAIGKIFSSTGLFGMSQSSPQYNGNTYLQSIATSYEDQLNNSSIKKPVWAICDRNYKVYVCSNNRDYPCKTQTVCTDGVTQYPSCTNDTYQKVVTVFNSNKITDQRTGNCRDTVAGEIATGCYEPIFLTAQEQVAVNSKTALETETQITRGCANSTVDSQANQIISDAIGSGQGQNNTGNQNTGGSTETTTKRIVNVALNRPVEMSVLRNDPLFKGENGNDGLPPSRCDVGLAVANPPKATWAVTLSKPFAIKYIAITQRPAFGCDQGWTESNLGTFKVEFIDENGNIIKSWNNLSIDVYFRNQIFLFNDKNTGKIESVKVIEPGREITPVGDTNVGVKKIRLTRTDGGILQFGEFEAFAEIEENTSTTPTGPSTPPTSPAKITTSNISNLRIPDGGYLNYWVNLNSTEDIPQMKLNLLLNKIVGTNVTGENLSDIFSTVEVYRTLSCGDSSAEPISNTIQNDIDLPAPTNPTKQYCLNIKATTKKPSILGSFELNTSLKDNAGLSSGTHKATFEIYSTTASTP